MAYQLAVVLRTLPPIARPVAPDIDDVAIVPYLRIEIQIRQGVLHGRRMMRPR